jgi:hypothetical protein
MLKQFKKWLGLDKQKTVPAMPPSEQGHWDDPQSEYLNFPKATHYHIPVRTEAEARFFTVQKMASTRKPVKSHLRWFGPGQGMLFMEKAPPTPDDLVKESWDGPKPLEHKPEVMVAYVSKDRGTEDGTQVTLNFQPDESTIRQAAYYKWIDAHCPEGQCERFWFEAERELNSEPTSGEQIRSVATPVELIRAGEKLLKEKKGD